MPSSEQIAQRPTVGFIGVGKLGRPMAMRLLEAGFRLSVYDRAPAALEAFESTSVTVATSAATLASNCDIVCICLPGPPEVRSLVLGQRGIAEHLRAGAVLVEHTTSSPRLVREIGAVLAGRGVAMVDAPVSGGIEGAAEGSLTALVGGSADDLERVRPVLETIAPTVVHVGGLGAGTVAKLMNNLASFTLDQVLAECLTIGVKAGVEPQALYNALLASSIGRATNLHVRLPDTFMKGDFEPRFTLSGARKDVALAVALAGEHDVPVRLAQRCLEEMDAAIARGYGDRDASIVMTLQEERARVRARAD